MGGYSLPFVSMNIWYSFPLKEIKLLDKHERWRRVAKILGLSARARLRLEWIIYSVTGHSVQETCRHYGLPRKTFYKWFNQFDEDNIYSLKRLEDKSRAPKHVRQRDITACEEERIVVLRKAHLCYGKMKLARIYQNTYHEKISSWKIQYTIRKYQLYPNPVKVAKTNRKRHSAHKKKRITELKLSWYQKRAGTIICLDTIVLHLAGCKRYIFTAIDKFGKVAFARMYKNKSSYNGQDFLYRLHFLLNGKINRVGHDNGTEFEKYFRETCLALRIQQYHSRPRTPKDNPDNERFNQTLETEFLNQGNFHPDPEVFNTKLTDWLVEYNFHRPHQTLGYRTPLELTKVSPMYPSTTAS